MQRESTIEITPALSGSLLFDGLPMEVRGHRPADDCSPNRFDCRSAGHSARSGTMPRSCG
jgi:hypothetical protein